MEHIISPVLNVYKILAAVTLSPLPIAAVIGGPICVQ